MHAIRVSRMGFHRRSLFAAARAITTPANAISSRSIALHMEAFDRSRRCFSTWRSSSFPKTSLKFIKVNYVTQQVVSGLMYYITLEAADGCLIKVYEAKVWEQIWLNSKELVKFTQIR
ncbi:hypothetical protein BUALT_Bualt01G0072200 [Buddleja alternifolia]|uniref:Cysteine proteinase inhibitor n=1 Tax=Buddleja alternifolia TaxID=168488 RepID=A0AAV6Y7E4_9LAMI|nr:hypothetical protein BUALT_Bualt01G0072200 [Buddleja alternifolia]